jgi:hypothetical protein
MISFEENIRELVKQMPAFVDGNGSFPIRYDWGTIDVLNKFLLLKENVSKYPLIWLATGVRTQDRIRNTVSSKARFVIATRSNKVDEFNEFQYQTDYTKILMPTYENFIKLLDRSSISEITGDNHECEFVPNYSFNNKDGLITIWNALSLDIEVKIDGNKCINTIKFT